MERADGFQMSAGHGVQDETASLAHFPGIADLVELDGQNER
jgi:hypothetical protein